MKRCIISNSKVADTLTYIVNVEFDIELEEDYSQIAATKYVNHPKVVKRDTVLFTDDSLEVYDDFIDSIITNVLNQDMVLVNREDPRFQSPDSYTVYPRFKIKNSSSGDRFILLFRMFDHDKRKENQNTFSGIVRFKTLNVSAHCIAQIDSYRGSIPVYRITAFRNTLQVCESVVDQCNSFKEEVSDRLGKTAQYIEWSKQVSSDLGIEFSYEDTDKSSNVQYYFYTSKRRNPYVIDEKAFIPIDTYQEFKQLIINFVGM